MVDAAPFQRVVQLAGAVGGEHHQRGRLGPDGADLRNGDLEVGQDLQQERLELIVGPVDLVDQQHRSLAGPNGRQQRPFQQELRPEERVDRGVVAQLPLREGADLQHLPRVVPLVQSLVGVDALVALQPDELAPEHGRERLGDLGLADADLALDQNRTPQRQRDEQRGGQSAVSQVATVAQNLGQLTDGLRTLHAALVSGRRGRARGPGRYRPMCSASPPA
jgi:hypothetical protein